MKKNEHEKEIRRLRAEIEKHNHLYYSEGRPEISDADYDVLFRNLKRLEDKYPELMLDDSPTLKVGSSPSTERGTLKHLKPMLSLDNTYSDAEIRSWIERITKTIGNSSGFIVEDKIDGVGISLLYEEGVLSRAATRGNGIEGEDITANIMTQKLIPRRLKGSSIPPIIEIRGEIFITHSELERINIKREASGEKPFSNPRNTCAGTLKLLDPNLVAERKMTAFFYAYGGREGGELPDRQKQLLETFSRWGLPTDNSFRFCRTEKEILSALKKMEEERDLKDYDIDGAVIKVDSISDQEKLGHTARSPRWAVAFKFRAKSAVTQLLQVSYNVGRTGVITPRATLKPVTVGGVTISSATLHNYDQIERLGVGIGDLVRIERGGDVIPKILNLEKKSPNSKKILPPETCPSCGEPSFREPEGVYYRCNNISCPAQMIRRIIHFASQDAMNIEGLGESVAAQLYHANLVENISDIYQLEKTDLLGLELFKEKRASNLMESIRESQNISLDSFIFALGIPNIGRQTSKTLAKRFGNIDSLMQADEDDLLSLEDVGEIVAASVREFFKSIKNREIIDKLIKYGVNPQYVAPQVGLLTGKRFVFTGILDKMKRKQAAALIETLGGKFSNALSRDTDFLVAGVGGGKKLVEAEKYGIRVISEEEFIEMTSSGEY